MWKAWRCRECRKWNAPLHALRCFGCNLERNKCALTDVELECQIVQDATIEQSLRDRGAAERSANVQRWKKVRAREQKKRDWVEWLRNRIVPEEERKEFSFFNVMFPDKQRKGEMLFCLAANLRILTLSFSRA